MEASFDDFDFGEGSDRTRLAYRSSASAFLRFVDEQEILTPETELAQLPVSISADFNAWMQTAEHTGPGPEGDGEPVATEQGYSASTRRLYLQALSRLLRFCWYREQLAISPEEETRVREALQIRQSREERRRVHTRSDQVPPDIGDRMLDVANALPLPTEEQMQHLRERRKG